MFFRLPHPPLCFEIPDEWWIASGAARFTPLTASYRGTGYSTESEALISLDAIAPMLRKPMVSRSHHGFRREDGFDGTGFGGMLQVLQSIVTGTHLPLVAVRPMRGTSAEGLAYVIRDGFHRFYAWHALGFTHLPRTVEDTGRSRPTVRRAVLGRMFRPHRRAPGATEAHAR